MARHAKWLARTVMCQFPKEGDSVIEVPPHQKAYSALTAQLNRERILETLKRNRYYEKPWMKRRRLAYEECKFIQKKELNRKMNFLIRQNRKEPWRI